MRRWIRVRGAPACVVLALALLPGAVAASGEPTPAGAPATAVETARDEGPPASGVPKASGVPSVSGVREASGGPEASRVPEASGEPTSPVGGPDRRGPTRTPGPTSPTPPPLADPSLRLSDNPVEEGSPVSLSGQDFDCADADTESAGPLLLTVPGRAPQSLTTDDLGSFNAPLPEDLAPGTHTLTASCEAGPGGSASTVLEVLPRARPDPAQVALSPDTGSEDTRVEVSGTGFGCEGALSLLWDGTEVQNATPDGEGGFSAVFRVPAGAGEGAHEVTARCGAPDGVEASETFTVTHTRPTPSDDETTEPPPGTTTPTGGATPSDGEREITIHLAGYPAACRDGSIVIGTRTLDTWLNPSSYEGDAGTGRWAFIDLHAKIPGDLKGRQDVVLSCPGRDTEIAGPIDLPPATYLSTYGLSSGPEPAPSRHVDPTPTGTGRGSTSHSTAPTPAPTESGSHVHEPSPNPSESGDSDDEAPGLVRALRTPSDVSWALKDLAGSVAMAAWFLLLVLLLEKAFPSQLADNAIGRWSRLRQARRATSARRPRPPRAARLPGWSRMGCFALLGGTLVAWADVETGWNAEAAVKVLGAAVGVLITLVTYEKTKDTLLRPGRGGVRAELRVVPAGIALALLLTALSRALEFPVPYVYGLVAVYVVLSGTRQAPGDGPSPPPPVTPTPAPYGRPPTRGGWAPPTAGWAPPTADGSPAPGGRGADPGGRPPGTGGRPPGTGGWTSSPSAGGPPAPGGRPPAPGGWASSPSAGGPPVPGGYVPTRVNPLPGPAGSPPGPVGPVAGIPKGQAVLLGGICVLAAALAVWTLGASRVEAARDASTGSPSYVLAYTLGLIVIGGVQVVVFGMLPLSGMDGHALKTWSRPAWYALYLTALLFFFHVLMHTVHPETEEGPAVSEDLRWRTLAIATGLFLAAWAFSLALRRAVARAERRAGVTPPPTPPPPPQPPPPHPPPPPPPSWSARPPYGRGPRW
ncbi:FGLLP motif-containing membrane protein [Streptomyces sp. SAJ15]|uniref:FGLLP motif-containing membrane protein n=1 Tax=Streptomyces sp. SAJ15 TaxID=2011095 RepID=UPI0011850C52|nr:FGLLP motif-containing membrane protein [Streptomyces sp. SAJ15]TVL88788.1 hypothetical protein CD790_30080 [Streptomyces sp. SAJ15]